MSDSEREDFIHRCVELDEQLRLLCSKYTPRVIGSVLSLFLVNVAKLQKNPENAFIELVKELNITWERYER